MNLSRSKAPITGVEVLVGIITVLALIGIAYLACTATPPVPRSFNGESHGQL